MAAEAHYGGKYIDAGCVDGLRIPVKLLVRNHPDFLLVGINDFAINRRLILGLIDQINFGLQDKWFR